jgi:hypothetical protein
MAEDALNEVIVYHDETKEVAGGRYRGHALFFVPKKLILAKNDTLFGTITCDYSPLRDLSRAIAEVRAGSALDKKLHFNDISGKKWGRFDSAVRTVVAIGVDALRRRSSTRFKRPLGCRLAVIFYPKKMDLSLYGGFEMKEKQLRHDETVLRMLLKGATHYLYNPSDRVVIKGVISDGLPSHRPLDQDRVIWQITVDALSGRTPMRQHVSFSEDAEIVHLPSDHKNYGSFEDDYAHANMLQLTDLLLGSVIRSCHVGCKDWPRPPKIGSEIETKRDIIAYPVKEMLDKEKRGRGFLKSGHYKAFSITCLSFANNEISFSKVSTLDIKMTCNNLCFRFP